MKVNVMKKSVIALLIAVLTISGIAILTTDTAFGATQYVTMATKASNYKGTIPVYKTAGESSQWTSGGQKGVLSKYVYATYAGSSGNYYKITWGDSYGYVNKDQASILESKPTGITQLTSAKKETHGVYTGYLAKNTFVTYENTSTGKIKWATYCNSASSAADEDNWISPGTAILSAL